MNTKHRSSLILFALAAACAGDKEPIEPVPPPSAPAVQPPTRHQELGDVLQESSGPARASSSDILFVGCNTWRGGACADPRPGDADGDGYQIAEDCNDNDPSVRPNMREIRCNDIDDDCDGSDLCFADVDQDGVTADADCDDENAARSPLRAEIPCNGVDENCDGLSTCDQDGDGHPAPLDCNDHKKSIHPLALDIACDGIDQDCKAGDCCNGDTDGDGHSCKNDCDDNDPNAHPGAAVVPGCYAKDLDCDGKVDGTDCL
jgi:hypothetical protein